MKPAEDVSLQKQTNTVQSTDNPESAAGQTAVAEAGEGTVTPLKAATATEGATEENKDKEKKERVNKPKGHRGHRQ